ncbi:MAG: hypothetical protein KC619_12785 [Myxococcales bacterium]|nr:hypothetical protein [Myxococcales bacterium]
MELVAYLALFAWGPVTLVLFARLRPAKATILSVLYATMFLPEAWNIDPPLLPPIDKTSVTGFWALVGCLWRGRGRLAAAKPFRGIDLAFVLVLLGNLGTVLTNGDPLVTGPVVRPGLVPYDALAGGIKDTLNLFLPFFVGRAMLREGRDLDDLSKSFVTAGLVYSALALVEIRLSPQLHRWTYGFHQMDFSMTMRWGGYRPMIFMATGMAVSMFVLLAALFATARWRARVERPYKALWLAFVVVLCKSTGAIVYAALALPLVALTKRPRLYVAAAFAAMVLSYPLLRATDVFPADFLVEQAQKVNEERALSLWFRFDQEAQLLERARERFLFGWGGYDRNRHFDPVTGGDLSVTDGDWAIVIGQRGIVGFLGVYAMLAFPAFYAFFAIRRLRDRRQRILLGALTLSASLLVVDLLPNGVFNCLPFFLMGAVHGLSTRILEREKKEARRRTAKRARRSPSAQEEASSSAASSRAAASSHV